MHAQNAVLIVLFVEILVTFAATYLSMKYVAPRLTGHGFSFKSGFWSAMLVVVLSIIGGTYLTNASASIMIQAIPESLAYFQAYAFLPMLWKILFGAVALYLAGKMLKNFVYIRSFAVALVTSTITFLVVSLMSLIIGGFLFSMASLLR